MICLREHAYAKLNLTLDVCGLRPDGYHELASVMTCISLCDEVQLQLQTGAPWQLHCDDAQLPTDEKNLCIKAAKQFFDAAQLDAQGLTMTLQKRIPQQAGLAGGSADAAAVLRALNRHYGCFSDEQLRKIGLSVGSDVPFCLFGGTALACGRGEQLTRLPKLPEQAAYVLVRPDFSASTPALFAQLDEHGIGVRPDTDAMCAAIASGNLQDVAAQLKNVFEPLIVSRFPAAQTARRALLDAGALGACLTGTGSVVFGVFDGVTAANDAKTALQKIFSSVFTAVNV